MLNFPFFLEKSREIFRHELFKLSENRLKMSQEKQKQKFNFDYFGGKNSNISMEKYWKK